MKFDITRYARPFVIAAVPLLLVAGAAFAAGGVPSFTTDPTSGPAAAESAQASDKAFETHAPEAAESAEASETPEAVETHDATETHGVNDDNSQGDEDSQESHDGDGDHNPAATAGATFGSHDGDGDHSGSTSTSAPDASGTPSWDGGHR